MKVTNTMEKCVTRIIAIILTLLSYYFFGYIGVALYAAFAFVLLGMCCVKSKDNDFKSDSNVF